MALVYFSLGGNLGNKFQNLKNAVRNIEAEIGSTFLLSSFYETGSWGYSDTNQYLNCVLITETSLNPEKILKKTQEIENRLGRRNKSTINQSGFPQYQQRTVDIDILFYDNQIINSENLTIPHPLISDRRFVLEPFNEISPNFIHPILNQSIKNLLTACKDKCFIKKYEPI
jgi:2-amino-4-hydroxy-6-hydroxymethyldihydropteridine diphosphokinase